MSVSPLAQVSPLAWVSPLAQVRAGVTIGPFTLVHDDVVLEDDVVVESHCVVGYPTPAAAGLPLVVGRGARLRTHTVLYAGSRYGPGLHTGHHATLREGITAGAGLGVGSFGDLQGETVIGDHVRAHSGVFIAQGTRIGSWVVLAPGVVLTDDPHPPSDIARAGAIIEDFAVLGARCTILPGVRIGTRSLVAAGATVTRDVGPDTVVGGVPARVLGPAGEVLLRDGSGRAAYPWMRHFHRGYPPEAVAAWRERYGELEPDPREAGS